MKILHIADIHLGKKIAGYSLLEDQKYFLDNTIEYMKNNNIGHIIIAGDIYDISSPSGEAIDTFNKFLNALKKNNIKAFIISGNHDSNERVGYGNKLFEDSNIYINTDIKEAINKISVDGINYYLFPYATALEINNKFGVSYKTYDEAMKYVMDQIVLDEGSVNIAVAHQLVLHDNNSPALGGGEEPIIGTIQNISSSIYDKFSYTALGHIHKPQKISEKIRYSGSPLAYHVDETKYDKTYTIIEVNGNDIKITEDKIIPLRGFVEIKDKFENIITKYEEYRDSYIYATITDEPVENAMAKIKNVYPYAIAIRYEKKDIKGVDINEKIEEIDNITLEELFYKLYAEQTEKALSEFQKEIVKKVLEEVENEAN